MEFLDLTGRVFGRLTVIDLHSRLGKNGGTKWLCRCTCGKEKPIATGSLTSGKTTSCGCYAIESNSLRNRVQLAGKVFGRWTVQGVHSTGARVLWNCRCECGTCRAVSAASLINGSSKSCGCYKDERASEVHTRHGESRHGKRTRTYNKWTSMRNRCYWKKSKQYADYGGRGITVCERWSSYENFLADMGEAPPGLTLERENNNLGYSPENCKWATMAQQARNKRKTTHGRLIIFNGETMSIAECAKRNGVARTGLYGHITRGRTPEEGVWYLRNNSRSTRGYRR